MAAIFITSASSTPPEQGHVQGREVAGGELLHIKVDAPDLEPALCCLSSEPPLSPSMSMK